MKEGMNVKKRLSGLLALALILAMTMGMTVNAAGATYYVTADTGVDGFQKVFRDSNCTTEAPTLLSAGDSIQSESGVFLIQINGKDAGAIEVSGGSNGLDFRYTISEQGYFTWKVTGKEGNLKDHESLFDSSAAPNVPFYYIVELTSYTPSDKHCPHSRVELRGVRETTVTEDGIRAWFCVDCGEKLSEEYLSSYAFFLESIIYQIENAEEGATVEISSEIWNSLSQEVMLALAARRDINIVFTLRYEHEDYRIEIPAGTEIDTNDKYYGPMYLGQLYGITKLEKE